MADWLLLRLPRVPDEPASWLVVDARGTPVGPPQSGTLTAAVTRAAGRRVWVIVPGTDVLLAEPEVPVKAGLKLQQLVPYALEEQLADNIEDLHFAIGKRASDSTRAPVAAVARALLDQWLATLRSSGSEPEAIYAESDLLPGNPAHAVVLLEEDAVFVRAPGAAPVTLPADALAEALEIAQSRGADSPGGGRGLILYAGAAEWERHSAQVEAARPRFEGIRIQLLTEGPLPVFAQQLPVATPINLLQGAYAPAAAGAAGLRAWSSASRPRAAPAEDCCPRCRRWRRRAIPCRASPCWRSSITTGRSTSGSPRRMRPASTGSARRCAATAGRPISRAAA